MTKFQYFVSFLILILIIIATAGSALFYYQKTSLSLSSEKSCTMKKINFNISNSKITNLTQLSKYNEICKSQIADNLMIFSDIPNNLEKVSASIISLQSRIFEITKYNLIPLIVLEPTFENANISFNKLASTEYNAIWDKYFSELVKFSPNLEAEWIFLPESNTPIWDQSNFNISDFGLIINQFGNNLKKYFPNNKLDLLFDSKSYDWSDKKWQKPSNQNFNQYLTKINKKLINKLWLQGFPYLPRRSEMPANKQTIRINDYLNIEILKQSADYLEIKEVGINTGTFSQKYLLAKDQINLTNDERENLQNSIIRIIQTLKNQGYTASLNLFLQNKLDTPEKTNWSYLDTPESIELFRQFIYKLNSNKIEISIFDS